MTPEDEYKFADERVRKSPGFKLQTALAYIAESRKILDGNTRELEEELEQLRGALSEFDWSKDPVGRAKISEINRRLYNYVTARMTLRDHTITELKHLGLWDESAWYRDVYLPKLKTILVKDSFAFLQDLRNFVSHNRVLPISAGISSGHDGEINQHISLDVERLKWDRWGAGAKRYLDGQGERIDISQLVSDYRAAVDEFYKWLPDELMRLHSNEIIDAQKLWDERERLRKRLVDRTGRRHD